MTCFGNSSVADAFGSVHFGQPDPGSKKSVQIMENFNVNQPKSKEYHTFKNKNIKLMFNGHIIFTP